MNAVQRGIAMVALATIVGVFVYMQMGEWV